LVIKYIIRLAKLFYIIVSICFFLGATWYIFCELILEHQEKEGFDEYLFMVD